MINKWDKRFLKLAQTVSEWSKDPSTKVGAVIAENHSHKVLSLGFNGFPYDMEDSALMLGQREKKYQRIIHAEMNALLQAKVPAFFLCTLYTWPLQPCSRCLIHMAQVGIERFVYPSTPPSMAERWRDDLQVAQEIADEMGLEMVEVEERL